MRITKQVVASKLSAYLQRRIQLPKLVDWAEYAIVDGEFVGKDSHALARIVGRIGVADVREFGLSWDDCYALLKELGYAVQVSIIPQPKTTAPESPLHKSFGRDLSSMDITAASYMNKGYSVEKREDGVYVGIRDGASKAGFTGPTQKSVISKIHKSHPNAAIHADQTQRGSRNKWSKP